MSTEPWRPNPTPNPYGSPYDRPPSRVPDEYLRIGDSERERAAAALGEHYAAGRLQRSELEERLDAAYAARTLADLERLFVDLPDPAPFRPGSAQRPAPPPQRHRHGHVELAFIVAVVCMLLALSVALTAVWGFPPFPLFFVFFWIALGRRRRVWL